jgi:hypothetical protein
LGGRDRGHGLLAMTIQLSPGSGEIRSSIRANGSSQLNSLA